MSYSTYTTQTLGYFAAHRTGPVKDQSIAETLEVHLLEGQVHAYGDGHMTASSAGHCVKPHVLCSESCAQWLSMQHLANVKQTLDRCQVCIHFVSWMWAHLVPEPGIQ